MSLNAYKGLKTFGRLFLSKFYHKKFLLSVSFIVTNRCNSRCSYCNSYNIPSEEMSTSEIFSMIDEFATIGVRRIGFTGGEPLLKEDIGNIISYAHKKEITTTLFSNGTLVSSKINELKYLDLLLLSLDGPPEIHDSIRGVRGSFNHVLAAIEAAREVRLPVWINTVMTKNNISQLHYLVDLAREKQVRLMFMPVFNHTLSADKNTIDELSADEGGFKKAINKLIISKKRGAPIVNSITYFEYVMENWPNFNRIQCRAGVNFCAVDPKGLIYPCHFFVGTDCGMDGRQIGFANAFERIKTPKCKGCFCNAYVELNLLIAGHLDVILNTAKNIEQRKRYN